MPIGQMTMKQLHIYTAHFDFTTAEIVINCKLKYVSDHISTLTPTCFLIWRDSEPSEDQSSLRPTVFATIVHVFVCPRID